MKDEAYVPSTSVSLKSLLIEYERQSQELIIPNGEMFGTQFNNTLIRAGQHVEQTPYLKRA